MVKLTCIGMNSLFLIRNEWNCFCVNGDGIGKQQQQHMARFCNSWKSMLHLIVNDDDAIVDMRCKSEPEMCHKCVIRKTRKDSSNFFFSRLEMIFRRGGKNYIVINCTVKNFEN